MPLKNGKLTHREHALAKAYAATGSKTQAAHQAGYASEAGASMALRRPAVSNLVDELFVSELQGQIVPLALKRHRQILADPKSTGPMLSKAVELSYKYGFMQRETAADKAIHDMTMAELQAIIRASEAARLIEGEVVESESAAARVGQAAEEVPAPARSLAEVFG